MPHMIAKIERSTGLGLPIGDGNEWNTGGSGSYYPSPFTPPGSHLPIVPGSNHPSNFEPFEPWTGPGYSPIPTGGSVGTPTGGTPVTPPGPTGGVKPIIRGVLTTGTTPGPTDTAATPTAAAASDLLSGAIAWMEANPVLGGAIAATAAGLIVYALTGKD